MPQHITTLEVPHPVDAVFDFLARPANLVQLAPPEMRLQLVEGPPRVHVGARVHWKARRMGVTQSLHNEVTAFEEAALIEEQQRQGPFKRWLFVQRFTASASGTQLVQELTYEPPGGLLGLLVSAAAIRRDLETLFAYRSQQLRDLLA